MHIQEYVETNNLTFDKAPFNNVDAAVLCALFYGRIENVIEGENDCDARRGVPVREFYKQEYFPGMFSDGITDQENKALLTTAAASPRFRDIKVYNVEVKDDANSDMQFAAATFSIDDNTDFVCFRGTDGTIHGWKEDFDMVFMDEVPSQGEAVDYLNRHYDIADSGELCQSLYVAGHSKGGNLAIYSSTMCADTVKGLIKTVYSFDGPGFKEDVLAALEDEWKKSPLDIKKFMPRDSMIGTIMSDNQDALVVKSDALLILQHSLYTWELEDNDFVYADNRSGLSEIFDDALSEWIHGASAAQRRTFVDVLFSVFSENELDTVNDLKSVKPADIRKILSSIKDVPEEDHEVMSELLSALLRSVVHTNHTHVRANVVNFMGNFGLDSPEDV
ncbi:MAG: DUF2974 domain-containing protein [Eubacterium sp.]|nr:DUF2974 domain-containing protein [Candidatus Colimonas fimequi]